MTIYKNCIDSPIKLRFDNKTMILLNRHGVSVSTDNTIIEVQKKVLVTTMSGINSIWKTISYEIDENNGIYENIFIKDLGLHSVSALI